jgi:ABC-type bacteriocin/lantibiotic exporter with double-glycine peptidase domain
VWHPIGLLFLPTFAKFLLSLQNHESRYVLDNFLVHVQLNFLTYLGYFFGLLVLFESTPTWLQQWIFIPVWRFILLTILVRHSTSEVSKRQVKIAQGSAFH